MGFNSWLTNRREIAQLKSWMHHHERLLVSGFLLGGFILHYLTFRTLEVRIMLIGLGAYLFLAAACIVAMPLTEGRAQPLIERFRLAIPLILQLCFGSLLSMTLLFFWFSGALSVSWPVFVLLLVLILFNETFRHVYLRPLVQVGLFSFVLFSYASILFPYLFNSLDQLVFLFGGAVSFVLSLLLIWLLVRVAPVLRKQAVAMCASVSVVFMAISALYVFNLLPPIPLALRDAGIYHTVKRVGSSYELIGEPETWWQQLLPWQTVHLDATGRLYAYTAIYSPAKLNTTIVHVWEKFDEQANAWKKFGNPSFTITGGRVDGYRGYTYQTGVTPGRWRVSVETERGQVLGRLYFDLVSN